MYFSVSLVHNFGLQNRNFTRHLKSYSAAASVEQCRAVVKRGRSWRFSFSPATPWQRQAALGCAQHTNMLAKSKESPAVVTAVMIVHLGSTSVPSVGVEVMVFRIVGVRNHWKMAGVRLLRRRERNPRHRSPHKKAPQLLRVQISKYMCQLRQHLHVLLLGRLP